MLLNTYLEVRIKHIKGQLSPGQVEWVPINQEEETAKAIKNTLKEALGLPVAQYRIPQKDNQELKCYLFTRVKLEDKTQRIHTMLEYTKQKKPPL